MSHLKRASKKEKNASPLSKNLLKKKSSGSWSAVYLIITDDETPLLNETQVYEALGFTGSAARSPKAILNASLLDCDDTEEMNFKKVYRKLMLVFHEDKFTEESCKVKARVVTRLLTHANEELQMKKQ